MGNAELKSVFKNAYKNENVSNLKLSAELLNQ